MSASAEVPHWPRSRSNISFSAEQPNSATRRLVGSCRRNFQGSPRSAYQRICSPSVARLANLGTERARRSPPGAVILAPPDERPILHGPVATPRMSPQNRAVIPSSITRERRWLDDTHRRPAPPVLRRHTEPARPLQRVGDPAGETGTSPPSPDSLCRQHRNPGVRNHPARLELALAPAPGPASKAIRTTAPPRLHNPVPRWQAQSIFP